MEHNQSVEKIVYKPILFIGGAFLFTWICIFALESTYIFSYDMPGILVAFFDFFKSASPLIVALLLLRKHFVEKGFLARYILGGTNKPIHYAIVALIFCLQFLTFYLFRPADGVLTAPIFLMTFCGQLIFGGGMEEGGWRGYLFPALKAKIPVLLASTITSVIWTLWHLPYFFIPTSSQYGSSIFAYMLITVMLGYLLSAIYLLTKSVLLCTLFHAFTNTVVMTMQADMGNSTLIVINIVVSLGGAIICQVLSAKEPV